MVEPFATSSDLSQRWRDPSPSEQGRVDTLLGDASALIRSRVPDVDLRLDAGDLDPDVPRMVACAMVKRALISDTDTPPVTQQSESFAGFSNSLTYANPTGDMYLTAQDLKALHGPRRAGMVDMMPDPGRPRY